MIINTALLKEDEAKNFETSYDAQDLNLEFVDFHYLKKIALHGTAERVRQTLTFHGMLNSRIKQICARCLESIEAELSAPFDLSYDITNKDSVDTTDDLRDILILEHPDRFLCKSDCRGICSYCGVNLNREQCRCNNGSEDKNLSERREIN